ncbi:MAG TPA: plastocyanin/azurin family copper-binding protein, partial [Actinomycetes bacterium]|nr:plastocyanin/azurin family copper-binding protein [Actinomycetes bacterium]
ARTVVVTMHHSRFEPSVVRVEPGERVRFVLRNTDPIDHEFILGDASVQRRHEEGRERQHHGDVPGERSVPAGQEATTTYTFPSTLEGRALEFACHLPGHYAYGMHGTARVSAG